MKIYNKNFLKGKKIILIFATSSLVMLSSCGDTYNTYYYPDSYTTNESEEKISYEDTIEISSNNSEKVASQEENIETSEIEETSTENYDDENNLTNDEKVFKYFDEEKKTLKEYLNSEKLDKAKEKGKELFITFVDFIFYDGEIKGIKYDDLSEAAKKQLFEDFCAMDEIISEYIPNYKENISSKYNAVKDFASPYYYSILSKIKEAIGSDNLEKINDFKDDASSKASDLINDGKQKLKEKYENWRNGDK